MRRALALAVILFACHETHEHAAREAALKHDLFEMRKAIDDFRADKKRGPYSLEELKAAKYLRHVPKDPLTNAADWRFARAVDELLNAVYDDVDAIKQLSPRALFDLFILKVLYVGRRSRHADVVDYLGRLLTSYLYTGELYPPDAQGKSSKMYFSNMLDERDVEERFENRFEAYRSYGDNALFVSGVFPASLKPRRSSRRSPMRRTPARTADGEYYVTTGKTMYRMAANDSGVTPYRLAALTLAPAPISSRTDSASFP